MIAFEHHRGELKKAVFAGNIEEILADLCCEISLIYGGICRSDGEETAEKFRELLGHLYSDEVGAKMLQETVFSDRLANSIAKAGTHHCVEKSARVSSDEEKDDLMKKFLAEAMSYESK